MSLPAAPLGEDELASRAEAIGRYIAGGLQVVADGHDVTGGVTAVRPVLEPYFATGAPAVGRVEVEVTFAAPAPVEELRLRLSLFAGVTTRHRAVVQIRWVDSASGQPPAPRSYTLEGQSEIVIRRAPARENLIARAAAFLGWGVHHIFSGFDHLAFLVVLLVASARLSQVVKIVTAFTTAHSITLLLAALGVVRMPVRITEAAIAASIIYVAAENLFRQRARFGAARRWPLAFGFGLVHGLGFASALRERLIAAPGDAPSVGRLLLPVLAFNLGVELGQLAVVAMVFPLLALARGIARRHERAEGGAAFGGLVAATSMPILVLGLYWFLQRITS